MIVDSNAKHIPKCDVYHVICKNHDPLVYMTVLRYIAVSCNPYAGAEVDYYLYPIYYINNIIHAKDKAINYADSKEYKGGLRDQRLALLYFNDGPKDVKDDELVLEANVKHGDSPFDTIITVASDELSIEITLTKTSLGVTSKCKIIHEEELDLQ